jgi:hypothetical protein
MEKILEFIIEAPSTDMLLNIVIHIIILALQLINICDVREYWLSKYGIERHRLTITGSTKAYLSLSRKEEVDIANKKATFPVIIIGLTLLVMTYSGLGIRHIMVLHLLFMMFRLTYIIRVIYDNGYVFFYKSNSDVKVIRCNTLQLKEKIQELGENTPRQRIGIFYLSNEELLKRYLEKST